MNRRLFGAFGVLAVVALPVGGCKSDPLSDGDGTPAAVTADFTYLQLPIGATALVTAQALDARTTPLDVPLTFTPCTSDVSVEIDTSYHPLPSTSTRAVVTAVSAAPTCVRISADGIEDTVSVAVLPAAFAGAFSAATLAGGDTLVISATNLLHFTPTAAVTVGGQTATVVARSATSLSVLVPFGVNGTATISGIDVTYVPGLVVTLPTTNTITQSGDQWGTGYASWQTATDWTSMLPTVSGDTTHATIELPATQGAICPEQLMAFGSTGPCAIFKFTVVDSARVRFRANWNGTAAAPDIDLLVCSDSTQANFDGNTGAPCAFEGFGGATGAKPQITNNRKYGPGTWYFVVENFDGTVSKSHYIDIIRP